MNKKRHYIWLADYSDKTHPGGAQLTNRRIIDKGLEMGLDIDEVYLKDYSEAFNFNLKGMDPIDPKHEEIENIFIINNYVRWYMAQPKIFDKLIERFKFVRFVHDYDFVYNGKIPEEVIKKVFEKADISFFLSPIHLEQTKLADIKIKNEYIIPSPIDVDAFSKAGFYSKHREKNSVIYIGEIATHKGINNIINYALMNPQMRLDICGWMADPFLVKSLPRNVRILDRITHDKMPEFLAKYEYSIHMPIWFEPFGRSVAEAFFAGCKLITNERVGFMSYFKTLSDIPMMVKMIKESPTVFWLKIEDHFKRIDDTSGLNNVQPGPIE